MLSCTECGNVARGRKEALCCDGCGFWWHRTCRTGISRNEYRQAVQAGGIDWYCAPCIAEAQASHFTDGNGSSFNPPAESTHIEMETEDSAEFGSPQSPTVISDDDERSEPIKALVQTSLEDAAPTPLPPQDAPTMFHLVDEGTQRRKTKLVHSLGFTYNVRSRRPYATYWQCTVRPKGNNCKATVIERDGVFTAGQAGHNHTAQVGSLTAAKIVAEVKRRAVNNVLKPVTAIVNEVLMNELPVGAPCAALPKPEYIARAANRLRQQLRPKDPHHNTKERSVTQLLKACSKLCEPTRVQ